MDGIGIGKQDDSNAVYLADTPTLDRLFSSKLYTQLQAHGTAVGLPTDQDMGNSEVGHNALGAGRVFDQGARLVNQALRSGAIFKTDIWRKIIQRAGMGGTVHFIGLLSDGNVHSHIEQLNALMDGCAEAGVSRVRVHALLDGRDVSERSALDYVIPTQERLNEISKKLGFDYGIASGGGE
jgi:2,3-bisphosphoglycerate-independent phosphoglycerate mutase